LLTQGLRSTSGGRDQRAKPRISVPFPADVQGHDDKGKTFNITTVLDNVSGNGLYLRMMPCVEPGTKLSIVLKLLTPSDLVDSEPRFAIEGVVVRAEEKTGGACGVAVTFDRVRFM
jgi:hypothetical protein